MAFLYVSEYADIGVVSGKGMQAPGVPAIASSRVAIDVTSTQSAAFNENTRLVRLHTDEICSVNFGLDPTAVATTGRMAADATEFFSVRPGYKVAVITNT